MLGYKTDLRAESLADLVAGVMKLHENRLGSEYMADAHLQLYLSNLCLLAHDVQQCVHLQDKAFKVRNRRSSCCIAKTGMNDIMALRPQLPPLDVKSVIIIIIIMHSGRQS